MKPVDDAEIAAQTASGADDEAAEQAQPQAATSSGSGVVETAPPSPTEQNPEPAQEPQRAYNDPREVRRRKREAELKAQGVSLKG